MYSYITLHGALRYAALSKADIPKTECLKDTIVTYPWENLHRNIRNSTLEWMQFSVQIHDQLEKWKEKISRNSLLSEIHGVSGTKPRLEWCRSGRRPLLQHWRVERPFSWLRMVIPFAPFWNSWREFLTMTSQAWLVWKIFRCFCWVNPGNFLRPGNPNRKAADVQVGQGPSRLEQQERRWTECISIRFWLYLKDPLCDEWIAVLLGPKPDKRRPAGFEANQMFEPGRRPNFSGVCEGHLETREFWVESRFWELYVTTMSQHYHNIVHESMFIFDCLSRVVQEWVDDNRPTMPFVVFLESGLICFEETGGIEQMIGNSSG